MRRARVPPNAWILAPTACEAHNPFVRGYLRLPVHVTVLQVRIDGCADRRIERAESIEELEALQLVFDRSFISAKRSSVPFARSVCSSSASMSADVTSMLVTGSA